MTPAPLMVEGHEELHEWAKHKILVESLKRHNYKPTLFDKIYSYLP